MKKLSYVIVLIIVLISSLISCSYSQTKSESVKEGLIYDSLNVINSTSKVFYALPSPEEVIDYVTNNQIRFSSKLLIGTKLEPSKDFKDNKTILLGLYFADMAYLSVYKRSDLMGSYFSKVDRLIKDIGLHPDISNDQYTKIMYSTSYPDSLYVISRELYDGVINYLQEFDEGRTLTLLSVGTIVESLYLSSYIQSDFEKQKESVNKIAEQQLIYKDVISLVNEYTNEPFFEQLYHNLKVVEQSFENLKVKNSKKEVEIDSDGKVVIKGKNDYDINEEDYFIFLDNIHDLRVFLLNSI
ncbi:hypothetical protein [Plebeiibacterium sediminum]|uniref:Lipoprotein n=1 Tax=Plebeiibacterium sediminum TaxID=2992112 RepID=A0AAE3M5D0_9BACT|nr:hypothetical protein [Plebeiobacterium sediminum]MCW3787492.1 hypothetical protein [Plebeiobacterium sediminum]